LPQAENFCVAALIRINSRRPARAILAGLGGVMSVSKSFLLLLGRALVGWYFVSQAVMRISNWDAMAILVEIKHVPMGQILLTFSLIAMLLGGVTLILGYQARLTAAVLVLCTGAWLLVAHDFWSIHDAVVRDSDYQTFALGIALLGGLLLMMGEGPGRFSLDAMISRQAEP
jgi:putative oxidoreductase